jgi:hypothetical protein
MAENPRNLRVLHQNGIPVEVDMVPPLGIEPSSAVYKTAASPQCFGGFGEAGIIAPAIR